MLRREYNLIKNFETVDLYKIVVFPRSATTFQWKKDTPDHNPPAVELHKQYDTRILIFALL